MHCVDCLELMKKLPDDVIDLTVTSPPYDNLRDYKNDVGKIWSFEVFKPRAKELFRITKKGGVVVWVVGDATINGSETGTSFKQALYFKEIGFNLHDTMIYEKNSSPYPSGKNSNRYTQVFEYMFILSKEKPKTSNLISDKKNVENSFSGSTFRQKNGELKKIQRKTINEFGVRFNVWQIPNGFSKSTKDKIAYKHPAIFPEKLANDHIISWSNKDDIVFDPFMGSGTTAVACERLGRKWIGCDISQEYCKIANERIKAEQAQLKLPL